MTSSGSSTNPWRYRGLLDVSPNATAVLDMGARYYSPQLGTFTAEDSVAGQAADPLSMNRFLYAEGDPTTLVDPDGHMVYMNCGDYDFCAMGSTSFSTQGVTSTVNTRRSYDRVRHHRWYRPRMAKDYDTNPIKVLSPFDLKNDPAFNGLQTAAAQGCIAGDPSACQVGDQALAFYSDTYEKYCAIAKSICEDAGRADVHRSLALGSLIPGFGVGFSVIDAFRYATEGDWDNAGLSLVGALPVLGAAGRLVRVGEDVGKLARLGEIAEESGAGEGKLFVNGSMTANNLTPRLKDVDGLSAWDTLEAGVNKGGKGACIEIACLIDGGLEAVPGGPPGHYSIRPISDEDLAAWLASRASGTFEESPFTQYLQSVAREVWNR